jgi:hypothetical protein
MRACRKAMQHNASGHETTASDEYRTIYSVLSPWQSGTLAQALHMKSTVTLDQAFKYYLDVFADRPYVRLNANKVSQESSSSYEPNGI